MKRLLGSALVLLLVAGAATAMAGQTEEDKIEAVIAAVVEAYNTGDYAAMGRYYTPDVTMMPSDYSPPIVGWSQVEERYRQAYARYGQVTLARENTKIVQRGKFAWASYQWRFAGISDQQTVEALGHTTLILEKRGGNWLIVHNHSSMVPTAPAPPPPAAPKK